MPKATRSSIKRFVRHSGALFTIGWMRGLIFPFAFFSFIAMIYGVVLGGIFLVPTISMVLSTIVYIVLIRILKRREETYALSFMCSGVASLFLVLILLLFAILFLMLKNAGFWYNVFVTGTFLFIILAYFALTFRAIRLDRYQNKKTRQKNNVATLALFGAVLGTWIAHTFLFGLEQDTAITLSIFAWLSLSLVSSIGLINFVKYYYVKKYSITPK